MLSIIYLFTYLFILFLFLFLFYFFIRICNVFAMGRIGSYVSTNFSYFSLPCNFPSIPTFQTDNFLENLAFFLKIILIAAKHEKVLLRLVSPF
jgi:hypothetical protein